MTKTLYLMRHGQTLFNQLKRIQGSSDSPLTDKGIADARQVGAYFKENEIHFDHAYCSTQERASDTLELITNQPYERLKGIKEWGFGVFEGESEVLNPKIDPVRQSHGEFFVQYGGESDVQVQARMVRTLTAIMDRPDNQQVLAVSHGGATFMFLRKWLSMDEIKRQKIVLDNCAVLKFTYEDGKFTFQSIRNLPTN
ncbi:histidine phosphatase family protein [Lactiplantibacillus fabifermentans]|uniref:Phosphoglycerate mutase n=2 Tax=Lactiplantibacillus fabifermentans TaxID=483011 RepID=A0A0R2NMP3_9LACO|nr:histidine phosphatase family protein [Lactiplantibacillus fabifermentans]ETY74334.1 phosphoglycerate mutase [Lactiplantibacillus fabifermentans T30PCM01]KRO27009.1 phosphoglycerate mutase [Lactiplantibacillus fabifermentans DSM 21115]